MMESEYLAGTSVVAEARSSSEGGYLSANGADNNNLESAMQQKKDISKDGSNKKNVRDMPLLDSDCGQSSDPQVRKVLRTVCFQFNGSSQKSKISFLKKETYTPSKCYILNKIFNKRKNKDTNLHSGPAKKLKEAQHEADCKSNLTFATKITNTPHLVDTKNHGLKFASAIKSNATLSNINLFDENPSDESHSQSENINPRPGLKKRLMHKTGSIEGEGSGIGGDLRTIEPVEVPNQKGREGSGLAPSYDTVKTKWDPSLEDIREKEPVDWLQNDLVDSPDLNTMLIQWLNQGPKNEDVQSMTEFVDKDLLHNILVKKELFVKLEARKLKEAITRSDPFGLIRRGIFLNRAALKMANIDYVFDHIFTNPKQRNFIPMVKDNELLYFADICGGPGGFSEYIFFRKKCQAKGIGFTLKGENDFKLESFRAGPSESFEPFYGLKNDGNVLDPSNVKSLTEYVMKVTNQEGVHFMMADGGSFVRGKENMQEVLSKKLYLCQFLVALNIVREEGHFVCKLFDLYSEFSASLIYLIYRSFNKISILKPNTSRPGNSERYIICKHKRCDTEEIRDYLSKVALKLWKFSPNSDVDINSLVPLKVMKSDNKFFNYLRDSNNRLGQREIFYKDKIIAFYRDQSLHEVMQNMLRTRCMELWNIPESLRKTDDMTVAGATKMIMESIIKWTNSPQLDILNFKRKPLNLNNIEEFFRHSNFNLECIPLGSDKLCFLLGLGGSRVYRWENSNWKQVANMELPPGTLIYGEFVPENRDEATGHTRSAAYQIIDGFALDYQPIAHYAYDKRLARLRLLSAALRKSNGLFPIRVTNPTPIKNINTILFNKFIKGVIFVRPTKDPWIKCLSTKTKSYYFYNTHTKESFYDPPLEAGASAIESLMNDKYWLAQPRDGIREKLLKLLK